MWYDQQGGGIIQHQARDLEDPSMISEYNKYLREFAYLTKVIAVTNRSSGIQVISTARGCTLRLSD